MSNEKIFLSSPHMGGNEQKYIREAFDSNWVAPLGPNVTGFEQAIENYLGNNVHVAALSAGTAALHLALILAGVEKGDEVVCQSFTFSASANPIVYQGATPVFVDSEPETWNMDPEALETAIKSRIGAGKKPKAIIAVHLYGMPFKVDEILEISRRYDIPLIEDAAEALGSKYKGRPCGTISDFGVLSFNGNKIITTSGGGALVCKNIEHTNKAVFLATQARDNAPHYQHSHIGFNYRMSNICAGIGRGQMEVIDERVAARRQMHEFYKEFFAPYDEVTVFDEPNEDYFSNHWLTAITIKPSGGRDREKLRLIFEEGNIESRPLWKPMHLQPIFSGCEYFGSDISEKLFNDGLCLPSGSNLTDADKDRIKVALRRFFS